MSMTAARLTSVVLSLLIVTPAFLADAAAAESNKDIARRFLIAGAAGDAATLKSLMASTAQSAFIVAGVYSPELKAFPNGLKWDREGTIKAQLDLQRSLKGPLALKIISMIGEGDRVAAEVESKGIRASTGREYLQHASYQFHLRGSQIADIRIYQDTLHYWDVWDNPGPPVAPRKDLPTSDGKAKPLGAAGTNDIGVNKEDVLRFLAAVPGRDPEGIRSSWAPDGIWSFAIGGEYAPELRTFRDAPSWPRDAMIGMQQGAQKGLKEPLTLDVYDLTGEGDKVSGEAIGMMVRPDGHAYRQHYGFHFTLRDGKIVEGHVYQDTLHQYDLGLARESYAPVAVGMPR